MRKLTLAALLFGTIALAIAACGGGDDDGANPFLDDDSAEPTAAGSDGGSAQNPSSGGGSSQPTLSADPGQAWAEVDGERLVYEANGSIHYTCDIGDAAVQVNFQTPEGHDLFIQANRQGDGWTGTLVFKPGSGENVQFDATLPADAHALGIAAGALSFEGTVYRIKDFNLQDREKLEARLAVNCESAGAGGDPMATIGGQEYRFPASGAQSFECEVSDDRVGVRVNRLSIDGLQLEIDGRQADGNWVGHVAVYTPNGTFTSTLPRDGTGLVIAGTSVTYDGAFTGGSEEAEGSVSITCP